MEVRTQIKKGRLFNVADVELRKVRKRTAQKDCGGLALPLLLFPQRAKNKSSALFFFFFRRHWGKKNLVYWVYGRQASRVQYITDIYFDRHETSDIHKFDDYTFCCRSKM